jgi:hypothetical protein
MVAQATLSKQANALINLYASHYLDKYSSQPTLNRFREKWGFQSMIEDLGYGRAQEVIAYYFKTGRLGHPVQYLLYNYDKLNIILREIAEDEITREELKAATAARVAEWEARQNGNSGS